MYLQVPSSGGTLQIYDRRGDTGGKLPVDSVAGVRSVRLQPRAGDLTFFNVDNYHEVTEVDEGRGRRIACHSQVGINEQTKEMAIWL